MEYPSQSFILCNNYRVANANFSYAKVAYPFCFSSAMVESDTVSDSQQLAMIESDTASDSQQLASLSIIYWGFDWIQFYILDFIN